MRQPLFLALDPALKLHQLYDTASGCKYRKASVKPLSNQRVIHARSSGKKPEDFLLPTGSWMSMGWCAML